MAYVLRLWSIMNARCIARYLHETHYHEIHVAFISDHSCKTLGTLFNFRNVYLGLSKVCMCGWLCMYCLLTFYDIDGRIVCYIDIDIACTLMDDLLPSNAI
jgi:hypothetical protein